MNSMEIALKAKEQLNALTGLRPDTVSKLLKEGQGWRVAVEMIEVKSIPDTKDLLATYDALLDESGALVSYERKQRYRRGDVM
jgi:hypothetical protein